MPDYIIVDTDILIDIARGTKKTASFLNKKKEQTDIAISSVTEMEMLVGCRNKTELSHLDKFLTDYKRIKINAHISDEAVKLLRHFRLSHGLLIADALIAATAIVTKAEFITKNYKDYQFIPGLKVVKFP